MSLTKVSYSMIQGTPINVLDYGADPTGSNDSTAAIEAAIAYSVSTASYDADRQMTWAGTQQPVYFPPGTYIYSGAGVVQSGNVNILLFAEKNTVTIKTTSNVYFLTANNIVINTYVKGINFQGGKGAIKYTNTSGNVTGEHIIEDCYFDGYTECAIGNNSTDMPYFKINRCMFLGDIAGGTIGVAIGGYIDSSTISDCSFLRNRYNLKIGPLISGNVNIIGCDFVAFTSGLLEADIWYVPNSTNSFGTNSGFGCTVELCKFGNENMQANNHRILVALENTSVGTDRLNHPHSTTWNDTTAYFSGLTIRKNRLSAVADTTAGFIRSYINNLCTLRFYDNEIGPANYAVLCEFTGTSANEDGYVMKNWLVQLDNMFTGNQIAFTYGLTNNDQSHALALDYQGFIQGTSESLLTHNSLSDDASYSPLANFVGYADISVAGGASKVAVNDIYGTNRAAEITVTDALGSSAAYGALASTVDSGQITWLEFDCKRSASNSVTHIQVDVRSYSTGMTAVKRTIFLQNAWKTVRIPFLFPNTTSTGTWQVRFKAFDYTAGTATSFDIGRIRVYHARQPMNGNRISTIGDGTWSGEHLVMGTYHLWVSAAGKLYIKNGAPSSDTDGTVVGTQT